MRFVLHTELVTGDARPSRLLYVLHGVFGSGANWRSVTRAVAKERPDWGFVLVDLRAHGRSQGARPPHDIEALAADLDALRFDLPVAGVVGHSLGGKVALAYSARHQNELYQLWVLDSHPGGRTFTGQTVEVLELLEGLPAAFADRGAFVDAVRAGGQSSTIASWLAMNVKKAGDEYMMQLDLPAIRSILADYYQRDMWSEVARGDGKRQIHLVIGGASPVWQPADRERAERLAAETPNVHLHVIEGAGHWLNVDAPEAVQRLFVEALP